MQKEAKGQTKNMLMNKTPLPALEEILVSVWSRRKKHQWVALLLAMDDAVSL